MKMIIRGKRYDTKTAMHCAHAHANCPMNDFGYWEEDLYRKTTGEYFIFGRGNAGSRYAEPCGQNCWGAGERIVPLTNEKARQWCEENANEEYEEIFGECED